MSMKYLLSNARTINLNIFGITLIIISATIILSGCLSSEPNNPEEAVNMYYTYLDEGKYDRAADLLYAVQRGDMGSDYPQPLLPEDREKLIQYMKKLYGEKGERIKIATLITRIKRSVENSIASNERVITEVQRIGIELYTVETQIICTLDGQNVTITKDHPVVEMGNWRLIIV
ncbi:MAG TPA: hypothetical protein VER35_02180 [Candidatus Limnocylindrales bacterium]|nr:hypothetical protein [Candidatus Limnocylindrales bacterium]